MIQLTALGRLELSGGEGIDFSGVLTQPKRLALLVYLALPSPGTMHRRDTLLGVFWPEVDQAHARNALRTSLSHIRHVLGQSAIDRRGDDEVGLNPELFTCDVAAFEAAISDGAWDTALSLYKGNLLEGFFLSDAIGFERWLEDERARLREAAAGAAWARAHQHIEAIQLVDAERTAQRAVLLIPTDESEARRFIVALADAGDRAAAIGFFEKFAQRLRDEYELEPSPETNAAVDSIRSRGVAVERSLDSVSGGNRRDERAAGTDASSSSIGEADIRPSTPRHTLGRRPVLWAGATVAVAVVIAVLALLPHDSSMALKPQYVAVSVFRNATGDPSLDLLGERLGNWITHGLQQAAVPVTPWTQAVQSWEYVQTETDAGRISDPVRSLAAETGANVIVAGAVYLVAADSLEVQMEVTDAARGRLLGTVDPVRAARNAESELLTYAQQRVMVFLSTRFEERLREFVAHEELGAAPTYEAYEEFREGLRHHFETNFEAAIPHFRRAFEPESTWALPLFRMGFALAQVGRLTEAESVVVVLEGLWDRLTPYQRAELEYIQAASGDESERELAALRRAAELAPGSGMVYNLARILQLRNRPREAVDVLRTLNPERGWARDWAPYWDALTVALHMLGEHEQALAEARRGYRMHQDETALFLKLQARELAALGRSAELDSILEKMETAEDVALVHLGFIRAAEVSRTQGHNQEAGEIAEKAIAWFERQPPSVLADAGHREWHGRALFLAGRLVEAQNVFDALVDGDPDGPELTRAARAYVSVARGDTVQALSDAAWFENRAYTGWNALKARVAITAVLGDSEGAMQLIRESGIEWVFFGADRANMLFEPLRGHSPWQEFLRPKG